MPSSAQPPFPVIPAFAGMTGKGGVGALEELRVGARREIGGPGGIAGGTGANDVDAGW